MKSYGLAEPVPKTYWHVQLLQGPALIIKTL